METPQPYAKPEMFIGCVFYDEAPRFYPGDPQPEIPATANLLRIDKYALT